MSDATSFATHFQQGKVHIHNGDWSAAVPCLEQAVLLRPDAPAIRSLLGIALLHCRQLAAAEEAFRETLRQDPGDVGAQLHLGILLHTTQRNRQARRFLKALVSENPTHVAALQFLGKVEYALGNFEQSGRCFQRIAQHTNNASDWLRAANLWLGINAHTSAARAFRAALEQDPALATAHAGLGQILLDNGALDDAEHHLQQALHIDPTHRHARIAVARMLLRRRDVASAQTMLSDIMKEDPSPEAVILWSQIQIRQGNAAGAVPFLEQSLAQKTTNTTRGLLLQRLAEARDRMSDPEGAMEAWTASRKTQPQLFDPPQHRRAIAAIKEGYTAGRPLSQASNQSTLPIFIVGMPRSGTSLLEQMLDCHPRLKGIGEREEVRRIAIALSQRKKQGGAPYYARLDEIDTAVLDHHAQRHLDFLNEQVPAGTSGVIDKMPHNFQHLGLLNQLFPKARFIHCLRDPVDTCFSCFRQRFDAGLSYTTRLDWLGVFYREYEGLMAHWQQQMPDRIHTVRYEAMVHQPEQTLRRVLAFLGEEWDARCLTFHQNTRDVGTASFEQVQQPLYTSSIGRSSPYLHLLDPLFQTLYDSALG